MREIEPVAVIYTAFPCKFGVPRQSGLTDTRAKIVFNKKYAVAEALRGIEEFSHLWLIWDFSLAHREGFSPTVRPPRLGGNERRGVFATRSPFRPNSLGLTCVKLIGVDYECENGPVLTVTGADIVSGTEIYDIKPYIPYADSVPDACGGFASAHENDTVEVEYLCEIPAGIKDSLTQILAQDPRPQYIEKDEKEYSFEFGSLRVKFVYSGGKITVVSAEKFTPQDK